MRVEAEDNAHVLIDFGEARFASVTTGFTMQRYRSPAIELYGADGVLQLLGDDWAPEGYELWRNAKGAWELFPESDPGWQWTEGLRHLVDCIETRPRARDAARACLSRARDHAGGAGGGRRRSSEGDRAATSRAPSSRNSRTSADGRRVHDPRSALIQGE